MKDFAMIAAEIIYDSQPAGEAEAFTKLRANIRIYNTVTDFRYRTGTFTDSPQNVERLRDFATTTAKKWLDEIVYFLSVVPEPEIICYEPALSCAPKEIKL